MTDLTLIQRFFFNSSLNDTTKILSIDLNDLTDAGDLTSLGLDISAIDASNVDDYASKILWALLLLSKEKQPTDNNDDTVGIYVTNQGKRTATRNNVAQFSFTLAVNAYTPDGLGVDLDPDLIG